MRHTVHDDRIIWNAAFTPDTEETELVRRAIVDLGLCTRDAVVRAVAEELFARDCRRAGGVDGFGLFRAWYVTGVNRLLDRLDGSAIVIEPMR
jgi:hypothetical protein